ncbi:MAG TPA: hypothetical protein PK191_06165 [Niabella sp.]|nr:hypothetical protein [Niabella sp.]HOZ95624.1 hypothetical protein [Niabella sp.]HQW13864.1 hypothetical protein [Niabella sp.]HQX19243.1 hypothetical protein [Niabella sp.]HQX41038.1 hypothetical protein [Niabella sp.]
MDTIFVFSGLGIDQRVFENIDFGPFPIKFINWITPFPNENIESYATRISTPLINENAIIIGLSFGGILGIEISKIKKIKKLILISSAKTKFELPLIFRMVGLCRLNKLFPNNILKHKNLVTSWLFGIESDKDGRLFKTILRDVDPAFLKWAINAVVNWQNETIPANCFHIHGRQDRVLPLKNIKADFIVETGGHFMTVNRSEEIGSLIRTSCATK